MGYQRIIDFSDYGEARFFERPSNGKNYVAIRGPEAQTENVVVVLRAAPTQLVTTPYTVADADRVILVDDDAVGGDVTVNLPPAADSNYRELAIKKIGNTGTLTIDGNNAETIDRLATIELTQPMDAVQLYCDGTEWWII